MTASRPMISRRKLIAGLSLGTGATLAGCDRIGESAGFQRVLDQGEKLNLGAHRLLTDRGALAREYRVDQLSPIFRSNGTTMPSGADYAGHVASGFADWRLIVDGLVARPLSLSLAQIRQMPARTQITRHDCVEGWSAIGQWTGVPLKLLLDAAGIGAAARYLVFHCADELGGALYYESIDLIDGFHPQTMLAWGLNGNDLPVANGAPLRLRVERMLGYKHAKYVGRVEAVASLATVRGGKGGTWEDLADYEWYAGI